MGGPHPPDHAVGADGPAPYAESQPVEFPPEPTAGEPAFGPPPGGEAAPPLSGAYPGQVPSPGYPKRRSKRRMIIGVLLAVALIAAMTVTIGYGVRTNGANTGATFSEASAKSAIQGYLD